MSDTAIYLSAKAAAFSIDSILADGGGSKRSKVQQARRNGKKRKAVGKESTGVCKVAIKQERDVDYGSCSSDVSSNAERHGQSTTTKRVRVELQHEQLWHKFHSLGTEMIITKVGRRMFPTIRVKVDGLESEENYFVVMDIIPVDDKRYRYAYHSSQWFLSGDSDALPAGQERVYIHPDSPSTGSFWQKQVLAFDKIKLTNNDTDASGHIILQSMKKYQPRIHVIKGDHLSHREAKDMVYGPQSTESSQTHLTFVFPETQFITVTAYQNQQITKLKIDRNPFAKGFRDLNRYRQTGDERTSPVGCSSILNPERRDSHVYDEARTFRSHHQPCSHLLSKPECCPACFPPPRISPCPGAYHEIKVHQWDESSIGKLRSPEAHPWGHCRNSGNNGVHCRLELR